MFSRKISFFTLIPVIYPQPVQILSRLSLSRFSKALGLYARHSEKLFQLQTTKLFFLSCKRSLCHFSCDLMVILFCLCAEERILCGIRRAKKNDMRNDCVV